ncbi:MAG: serine/threonine-protein kinase [Lachnospiraceae bacterium]|nr:serine/threonine-protein kinase [Lachnospiraceae bacterium]
MPKIIASTYQVIEEIGSGGAGRIYLAEHLRLGKKVVLKADKRKVTTRTELLRREADTLKNLRHPYIPQVYDFIVEDGIVYTAMDYVEGESLDRALNRGERFTQPQVIRWARQLLDALCYLHSPIHGEPPRGYVHSDIKPANLMCTPSGDICLIDFNIALALGEEHVVGRSPGYASPEHFGLDYSSSGTESMNISDQETKRETDRETLTQMDQTMKPDRDPSVLSGSSASFAKKVTPDVRSDIYSVGATLYHLLSGQRPSANAMEVVRLSEQEFSPQIVEIIAKAMCPNPELRYQSAAEMLDALTGLYENDDRMKRFRRNTVRGGVLLAVIFFFGLGMTLTGLKRMQTTESWLKLAEYAQTALAEGNSDAALSYALQALPTGRSFLQPDYTAEAQMALTDALGVYDLSDGFRIYRTAELPDNPLYMDIASDGTTAACVYSGSVCVIDTETAEQIVSLPAVSSALAEVQYLNDHAILYAGSDGICAYDISDGTVLWTGEPATAICVSGDGGTAAAVCKDDSFAVVYDTATGEEKCRVDFGGRSQSVTVNDSFANPSDNLFVLNADGTLLGASFSDGSLSVFDLENPDEQTDIFDNTSGFTHFEGGFYEQYFAFSGSDASSSVFAVIDTDQMVQTGGFEAESSFGVQTDENGIYVQSENILVRIDPVTGDQEPLVTTSENLYRFAVSDTHTAVLYQDGILFFDSDAQLTERFENTAGDFIEIANGVALVGSMDSDKIRILKYENHAEAEVFTYDSGYDHDEARISADGETVMLFSYKEFRLYRMTGDLICEVSIPDADQVYDQQFVREEGESCLEVTYNDGTVITYSARDGSVLSEIQGEIPDASLYEEFYTDSFRIESPLHGTPVVYSLTSGREICELEEDAYLTYITQVGENIVAQYYTTDGEYYGLLYNSDWETIAYLPDLCDVYEEELYFDYSTGNLRKSQIFNIDELIMMGQNETEGRKTE